MRLKPLTANAYILGKQQMPTFWVNSYNNIAMHICKIAMRISVKHCGAIHAKYCSKVAQIVKMMSIIWI